MGGHRGAVAAAAPGWAPGEAPPPGDRGGEPLPGARGGVFTQKITAAEQVLATVLYQRNLCTQDTLAELFNVSRRTSNVVRELGPGVSPFLWTRVYAAIWLMCL